MADVRFVTYDLQTGVAAAAGTYDIEGALRDILPDERFEILGFAVHIRAQTAVTHGIQLVKNRGRLAAGAAGGEVAVNHGIFCTYEQDAIGHHNWSVQLMRAMDFDQDDSLNIYFAWGLQGAGESGIFDVTFWYRKR